MKKLTSKYAINLPSIIALPILKSEELFPVRRIYFIGRNYAANAVKMGHDPDREPLFFFPKTQIIWTPLVNSHIRQIRVLYIMTLRLL